MKLLKPSFKIITPIDKNYILKLIEEVSRTCYKSEDQITEGPESAIKIIKGPLMTRSHTAMFEFFDVIVRVICDRGVTHEIVRHRIASYAQESTRYCNYGKDKFDNGVQFIDIKDVLPMEVGKNAIHPVTKESHIVTEEDILYWYGEWYQAMMDAEKHYLNMVNRWCPAQIARGVLPNSTKTEIVIKFNIREWIHFFTLRTAHSAHPQMQQVMRPLLDEFKNRIPIFFDKVEY
jgi:thymidylate synthase (FAD)